MKVEKSLIHRLFYPQVPLVMAALAGGRVSAMPVVSYASVSEDPPLIAVACSPKGFTCRLALRSRCYSLSILDRGKLEAVSKLATVSGAKVKDKLSEVGLAYTLGTKLKVPVLRDAVATAECSLKLHPKVGDHLLLVGEVVSVRASDSFSDFWDFSNYKPILYTGWREGLTTFPEH